LSSAALDPLVERIRALNAQLDEGDAVGAAATTEPPASTGPPAMPT
jgi:hypothetical protein